MDSRSDIMVHLVLIIFSYVGIEVPQTTSIRFRDSYTDHKILILTLKVYSTSAVYFEGIHHPISVTLVLLFTLMAYIIRSH